MSVSDSDAETSAWPKGLVGALCEIAGRFVVDDDPPDYPEFVVRSLDAAVAWRNENGNPEVVRTVAPTPESDEPEVLRRIQNAETLRSVADGYCEGCDVYRDAILDLITHTGTGDGGYRTDDLAPLLAALAALVVSDLP